MNQESKIISAALRACGYSLYKEDTQIILSIIDAVRNDQDISIKEVLRIQARAEIAIAPPGEAQNIIDHQAADPTE